MLGADVRTERDDIRVKVLGYDMDDLLRSCCDWYEELCGHKVKWRKVDTPFLGETNDPDRNRGPVSEGDGLQCPYCDGIYPGGSFGKVCKGQASHRRAQTKLCATIEQEAEVKTGALELAAAKIIMEVSCVRRMARCRFLRVFGDLA